MNVDIGVENQGKISLVGYMGSGKTFFGKKLSEELNLPFIDLDEEIEKEERNTVSKIIETKGELYFRKIERKVLLEILVRPQFVLSCGGGTPVYYDNMEMLNNSTRSVFIELPIPILNERLLKALDNRPLLPKEKDLSEFIGKHLFERRPYYAKANHIFRPQKESFDHLIALCQ